jgi:hypothetical protein
MFTPGVSAKWCVRKVMGCFVIICGCLHGFFLHGSDTEVTIVMISAGAGLLGITTIDGRKVSEVRNGGKPLQQ